MALRSAIGDALLIVRFRTSQLGNRDEGEETRCEILGSFRAGMTGSTTRASGSNTQFTPRTDQLGNLRMPNNTMPSKHRTAPAPGHKTYIKRRLDDCGFLMANKVGRSVARDTAVVLLWNVWKIGAVERAVMMKI
jgi:hypothetical protein